MAFPVLDERFFAERRKEVIGSDLSTADKQRFLDRLEAAYRVLVLRETGPEEAERASEIDDWWVGPIEREQYEVLWEGAWRDLREADITPEERKRREEEYRERRRRMDEERAIAIAEGRLAE